MAGWKFLTNHALVLCLIAKHPRITAREISARIGITEKATRNIIKDLEAEGYITKKKEGRRLKYSFDPNMPLRGETEQGRAVGDLLEILGWKRRRRKTPAPEQTELIPS
ncbi:MAG: winged helix-turn-helix domain-containing protein [Dehalococcoidales bacterium]|nr:winged helix-turn-helix domain-containing protein [Dehalococcoidales bacterium]